jgi:cytochrome bd-type quinol oxidase subunit 1
MLDNRTISSISVMRSGAVTAHVAPNSWLRIRCGLRSVLINGSGFRHTIVSAITQLLDSVLPFRSLTSGCLRPVTLPQLTMGLALLIVVLKTMALRTNDERYNIAARFWARIFSVNFLLGVVTGIPMEFQFGTNWSEVSRRTGGVIGQPLAMEGVFSFFLESTFLGLFLFGEKRLSKFAHWGAASLVFLGSWISGFFIIVTDAWMQHPVAYRLLLNGTYEVSSFWGLMMNPWAWLQYTHNMSGTVITGAFVMAVVGALYVLQTVKATTAGSSSNLVC